MDTFNAQNKKMVNHQPQIILSAIDEIANKGVVSAPCRSLKKCNDE